MNKTKSYWLVILVSALLISLLINQINHVYTAAIEQEAYFNDKVNSSLESIVSKVSGDYQVCKSINSCFNDCSSSFCVTSFKSKKEWKSVDSIIQKELKASNINLNYNFEFCSSTPENTNINKNTYTTNLSKLIPKSGIMMNLEFPSKSNYLLKQIGPAFISSILIILLISIMFIIMFRFYNKEKRNAERTRDFLNNMTHEFKTPLANIAFASNLLSNQSANITEDKIKKYTQIIRSENKKMIDSSEDILEMAKQEFDLTKITLENINVHDIIYDLKRSFKASHSDSSLNISLHLNANIYNVNGITSFLHNALSNILDNAIKYCKDVPNISISTINKNKFLIITIDDNGVGINKNELPFVFDKFYRVSTGNRHDVKGFGLGLSYVKMVIQQMKGTITLKSNLGKGSTFNIKLPISND